MYSVRKYACNHRILRGISMKLPALLLAVTLTYAMIAMDENPAFSQPKQPAYASDPLANVMLAAGRRRTAAMDQAKPVADHPMVDKKEQKEHKQQAQPYSKTVQEALAFRYMWLRAGINAHSSWIVQDSQQQLWLICNRLQGCCRRHIKGE